MKTAQQCALGLVKKHGLSQEEADHIAALAWAEKAALEAQGGFKPTELIKAMEDAFDAERLTNIKNRQNTANNIRLYRKYRNEWDNLRNSDSRFTEGKLSFVDFIMSDLVGAGERFEGARASAASDAVGLFNGKSGQLFSQWENIAEKYGQNRDAIPRVLADKASPGEQLDFINEVLNPGSTENAMMTEAAAVWSAMVEDLRIRGNMAGGDTGKLTTGYLPQSHDPTKLVDVKNGGEQGWVDFVVDRLDWERTMPDIAPEDRRGILRSMYNTIKLNRDLEMHVPEYPMPRSVGNTRHRIMHFKDGKSFQEYHQRYGTGSLFWGVSTHLRQATTRITLLEKLGNKPEEMVGRLVEAEKTRLRYAAQDEKLTAKERTRAEWEFKRLNNAYNTSFKSNPGGEIARAMKVLMGETRSPVNINAAAVGSSLRSFQALTSMGLSGISTLTDAATTNAIQRAFGVPLWERFGSAVFDYFKSYKGDKRRLAQELGFLTQATWGNLLSRFEIGDQTPGKLAKLMNNFYKYSGLSPLSEQKKVGNAMLMSRLFGMSKDKAWDALDINLRKGMEYHGFTERSWSLMRNMMEEFEGDWYLNPTLAKSLTENQLNPLLPDYLKTKPERMTAEQYRLALDREYYRMRNDIETQVLSFYNDNSKFAIMEPDAKAQVTLTLGTRPGTPEGEILRAVMQFKSWPIMMVQRHVVGQTWKKFGTTGFDAPGAIQFLIMGLTTGYLSQSLKDIAKGRTPKDINKWETLMAAAWQGGFFGLYGDIVFGPQIGQGGTLARNALGPVGGMLNEVSDIPGLLIRGEAEKARDKLARTAMSNIPYANLWFTKAATDYFLFNELKELMSPGYKRRMIRQMQKMYGQQPLF